MENRLDPEHWKQGDKIHLKTTGGSTRTIVITGGNVVVGFDWYYAHSPNHNSTRPWIPNMHDLENNGWHVERASTNNPMEKFARDQCQ